MISEKEFFDFYYTKANNQYKKEGDHTLTAYGWWMQQNGHEFWSMIEKVQQIKPKTIVEIGSAHGGTLIFFDQLVGEGGLVIGLTWPQDIAFSCLKYMPSYKRKGEIIGIECNTHLDKTKDLLVEKLNGREVDFMFIDGDHSHNGCLQDYEMYSPLVKKGGIIGFHDVAIEPGIKKLFHETLQGKKELLPVHYQGIGLIYKE